MAHRWWVVAALSALVVGCGEPPGGYRVPTHAKTLRSGVVVEVTSCLLAWGGEHDERQASKDAFVLEYVTKIAQSDGAALDREALDVFELIRPVSEQWGLNIATVAGFSSTKRTGKYSLHVFTRAADGSWAHVRTPMKVYNTESGDR
jgi:hypothetical protein